MDLIQLFNLVFYVYIYAYVFHNWISRSPIPRDFSRFGVDPVSIYRGTLSQLWDFQHLWRRRLAP